MYDVLEEKCINNKVDSSFLKVANLQFGTNKDIHIRLPARFHCLV